MRKYILYSLLLISGFLQAQDSLPVKSSRKHIEEGTINIYGDSAIGKAVKTHISLNKKRCPNLVKGYRVQIHSSSGAGSREKASADKIKFLSLFPDITTHSIWDQPNNKVRVGDCRTKFEAEQLKKLIMVNFPNSFVVPDYIETYYIKDCD